MKLLIAFLIFLFPLLIFPQGNLLLNYNSECISQELIEDGKHLQERITKIYKKGKNKIIEALIIKQCGQQFKIDYSRTNDTLHIQTTSLEYETSISPEGDSIYIINSELDCECLFKLEMEFNIDFTPAIYIDNTQLQFTKQKFKTFVPVYHTYKGDTTACDDKYGLRQGVMIFQRGQYLIKNYYSNDTMYKWEIFENDSLLKSGRKDFEYLNEMQKLSVDAL